MIADESIEFGSAEDANCESEDSQMRISTQMPITTSEPMDIIVENNGNVNLKIAVVDKNDEEEYERVEYIEEEYIEEEEYMQVDYTEEEYLDEEYIIKE